jgi:hypothetical protein
MRSPTVSRLMLIPTHGLLNDQDQYSHCAENNKEFITAQPAWGKGGVMGRRSRPITPPIFQQQG